jgi:hypothetical protein
MWRNISGADFSKAVPFILLFLFQHFMERISRGRLAGIEIVNLVYFGSKDLGKLAGFEHHNAYHTGR